jgi:hypothetical protein
MYSSAKKLSFLVNNDIFTMLLGDFILLPCRWLARFIVKYIMACFMLLKVLSMPGSLT